MVSEYYSIRESYLTFYLGKELFGIKISNINSINELTKLEANDSTPDQILGYLKLKNKSIAVIDGMTLIGKETTNYNIYNCIIILKKESLHEEKYLGIIVSSINEVFEIQQNELMISTSPEINYKFNFVDSICYISNEKQVKLINSDHIFGIVEPQLNSDNPIEMIVETT